MPRTLAAVAVLLAAATADARPPRPDAAKYGWHADYNAALAEAKRTGRPIFLVFRCEP